MLDSMLNEFFFSSRRRHTRCSRDWSSDVCSSDLIIIMDAPLHKPPAGPAPAYTQGAAAARKESAQSCRRCPFAPRSEEHTSELQSRLHLVCRLLLEKK